MRVSNACQSLYEKLRKHKPLVDCYNQFLKFIEGDEGKATCDVQFSCECCESDNTVADYAFGAVTICASSGPVKQEDLDGVARSICHELVHATQFQPCNPGGKKDPHIVRPDCSTALLLEFEAYACAGQCPMENNKLNVYECAKQAFGSAQKFCKTQAEVNKAMEDLAAWYKGQKDAVESLKFCTIQMKPPARP